LRRCPFPLQYPFLGSVSNSNHYSLVRACAINTLHSTSTSHGLTNYNTPLAFEGNLKSYMLHNCLWRKPARYTGWARVPSGCRADSCRARERRALFSSSSSRLLRLPLEDRLGPKETPAQVENKYQTAKVARVEPECDSGTYSTKHRPSSGGTYHNKNSSSSTTTRGSQAWGSYSIAVLHCSPLLIRVSCSAVSSMGKL
jgi:hypothetical protein